MDRLIRDQVFRALDFVAARGPLRPLGVLIRWAFVFYLELRRDLAFVRAAGMAYATLVALVPGLAVVLFVLQASGTTDDPGGVVGMVLDRVFGAVPGLADTVLGMLAGLDLHALGVASLITLLVVASQLYLMVERAYCDVFGVPVSRRGMGMRLLSFYFTITAVPVVVVLALRSSLRLASEFGIGQRGGDWAVVLLEYVVLVTALKMLPATAVRWRPALLGALVSFVRIEVGRYGFGLYLAWVLDAGTMAAVYGSLATFPVFLTWVYLLWVFVLLGVEVAQVSQNYATLVEKELELAEDRPTWPSVEDALRVACWLGWSFQSGRGPVDPDVLAERAGLDRRALYEVIEVLVSGGLVVRTDRGWLLARPASAIALADVARVWREHTEAAVRDDPLGQEVGRALALDGTLADGIARWLPAVGPSPRPAGTAAG